MKKAIAKLEDLLSLELQSLYNGEKILKEEINTMLPFTESETLKSILIKYAESCDHKRLKLDRMFSYLMEEHSSKANAVIYKLLEETLVRVKHSVSGKIRSLALISGFQLINHYKITAYKAALMYSLELELDTVADLLHQIIEWERKTEKALAELSNKEFCKSADATQPSV
jgi:ferritin-like metal-binding protein YciE